MTPHIFRPVRSDTGIGRTTCAEPGCYLTPDEHMEAMARLTGRQVAALEGLCAIGSPGGGALVAPLRRGRPIKHTRAERVALGLPCCSLTPNCPRAPSKGRKSCPQCREEKAVVRYSKQPPGPRTEMHFEVPLEMAGRAAVVAAAERISLSEWVRRAIAEKLDRNAPMDSPANGV